MNKIWKSIYGYEGLYEISNFGDVRSLDRIIYQPNAKCGHGVYRKIKGCFIRNQDNGNGYMMVQLKRDGKREVRYVHRLVAEHFVLNTNEFPVVNHLDFNKENNRADNLQWCTQIENVRHSAQNMVGIQKNCKPGASGEKYISKKKIRGIYKYIVLFRKKQYGVFKNLNDAVKRRDDVVGKYIAAR